MDRYLIYNGLTILAILITLGAQGFISLTYSRYKKVPNRKGKSGSEVAREILDANGLKDIYVVETKGYLSDHYDPSRKVIRLSTDVYHEESVASIAIAAHECGHAIQDKDNYSFMRIRSMLVPVVNFCSYAGYFAIVLGAIFRMMNLIWLGILAEVAILVFQLVTLPVEIDASKRAMKEIEKLGTLDKNELDQGRLVLISAAMTYVASLTATLLEVLRLVLIYTQNDRD